MRIALELLQIMKERYPLTHGAHELYLLQSPLSEREHNCIALSMCCGNGGPRLEFYFDESDLDKPALVLADEIETLIPLAHRYTFRALWTKHVKRYHYHAKWSEQDKEYVALCDEFPSLSWLDALESEALRGIQKLVEDTVRDMVANNETPPLTT